MGSWIKRSVDVHRAGLRLAAVQAMEERDEGVTVAHVASLHHTSVPSLYRWRAHVLDALLDAAPGPAPADAERRALLAENARLRAQSATSPRPLSRREHRALVLQLHGEGVSVRGIQALLATRLGANEAASSGALCTFLQRAGRLARTLLVTLVQPALARVVTVAGDDIYLHGQGVKVTMEPVSGVVLDVRRWHDRHAAVWDLILSQYPALRLFVGDGAKEFDAAAELRGVRRGLDLMHERQWWTRSVFRRLSAMEHTLAERLVSLRKRLVKCSEPDPEIARTEKARRAVEAAFYEMVAIEEQILSLFRPIDAEGRRWTPTRAEATADAVIDALARMRDGAGVRPIANAAYEHVLHSYLGYLAHHALWNDVPVVLRAGANWSRERVLDALDRARIERQRAHAPGLAPWERLWHRSSAEQWLAQVDEQVEGLAATQAAIESLLACPRRSSSLVESFNARIRVLQMARRNVSEAMLGLSALQWNLTVREDGPRRGTRPYELLGVIEKTDRRAWWDVLLDAMEQEDNGAQSAQAA